MTASLFFLLLAASPGEPGVEEREDFRPPAGEAQTSPVSPAGPNEGEFAPAVKSAELLIVSGKFGEARASLLELEQVRPNDNQIQFLLALLDRRDGNLDAAISRWRRILVREPGAIRVRLELGRAYYELGDHANARRQFQFARAGKIPQSVARNIDRYLYSIRELKTFDFGFSFSIAPNSNRNAGPGTDTVTLYGLPFELSEDAKASSGVGLLVNATAEWAPRLSRRTKMRAGGQVFRAQYKESRFNDMTLAAYAGPRLNLRKWQFNLLGNFARRWYGDKRYSDLAGAGADVTFFVNGRLGVGAGANLYHQKYFRNARQSGSGYSLTGNAFYLPNTISFVRASVQLRRQDARSKAYAHDDLLVGMSYVHEFKGGFTLSLEPTFTRIAYDEPLAAFGVRRIDRQYTGKVALLNRQIDIYGITPRISYTYTRNDSTIAFNRFRRSIFEFGFTSLF